jgi:putative exosortase-associated protein (TIGR04073 family)
LKDWGSGAPSKSRQPGQEISKPGGTKASLQDPGLQANVQPSTRSASNERIPMRKTLPLFAALLATSLLMAGCAGPECKLGRGLRNTFEIVRGGEMQRSVEQSALFDSPDYAYTTGFIKGLDRTFARTGVGLYEVLTFPIPNGSRGYDPVCTDYLAPNPVYADSYTPTLVEDQIFSTDTNLGFSGGDVAPGVPGSRFRLFDTH